MSPDPRAEAVRWLQLAADEYENGSRGDQYERATAAATIGHGWATLAAYTEVTVDPSPSGQAAVNALFDGEYEQLRADTGGGERG